MKTIFIRSISRFMKNENGDGIPYMVMISGALILVSIVAIAAFPAVRTQMNAFLNNAINYMSSFSSVVT